MLKILGVLDIICSIAILLIAFKIRLYPVIVIVAGAYLLVKVFLFITTFNLASAFDTYASFCLFASLFFSIPLIFLFIAAALILQKGFFSLAG